ncbi:HAD family hydrolase [Bacillus sp. FJAT-26390]|uniref:HAD-IIB family hydrolase n=1 Tax=Bacillus sp. FJAT-26390 TaxID=1743142 RepID=UPI000807C881|nr:HAD family hydrolase [Bacillus sp. FJAT-26390]OBZ17159.1 HAD family hydrolase [Bacillus sp. FJAT-26390]
MIFVFDLDGTICFKGQPVSETILSCLEDLAHAGHEVIFASARPIRDMLPVLHERFHRFSLIGGNGSLVSKEGSITHIETFSEDLKNVLLKHIEEHQATYLIDSHWDYAYTGALDHPILKNVDTSNLANRVDAESLLSIVKILIITANDSEVLEQKLSSLGVVVHRHRNENVIDISPQNIHKWSALQKLGVEEKQFIAFGNDTNDITMFKNAQQAIMIGHHDELAQYATEAIPLVGDYEAKIVEKLQELASSITQHAIINEFHEMR